MATIIGGYKCVYGVKKVKPLFGFPNGKTRIRMRNDKFAIASIKTEHGLRQFVIQEKRGMWMPAFEIGSNVVPVAM